LYQYDGSVWRKLVNTDDLAGVITETQIEDDAITTPKLAANAVTANEILGGTITGDKIVANTITGGLLATAGIITTAAQVENAVIANAAIQNGAITNAKIGTAEVDTLKIADEAVIIPEADGGATNTTLTTGYKDIGNSVQIIWTNQAQRPSAVFLQGVITVKNSTNNNNIPIEGGFRLLSGTGSFVSETGQATANFAGASDGYAQIVVNTIFDPTSNFQATFQLRARLLQSSTNIVATEYSAVLLGARR